MTEHAYLYPYSASEAKSRDELALWRSSYKANIECKEGIEKAIRSNFDGMHLNSSCAASIVSEFGYKRTAFVLANTLKEKPWDGRFSPDNLNWAKEIFVPMDNAHNSSFVVDSHPAVLNGFIDQYRKEFRSLGLYGPDQCVPNSREELDYEGRVLVLSPDTLKESYWTPQDQLWFAHDGFGCRPHAIGRSIRCTCLGDGESTRWNRSDFIGVLCTELLPSWASENLSELRKQSLSDSSVDTHQVKKSQEMSL